MSSSLTGRLLVAGPAIADDNFHRTIVLVLEHGEEGAVGVVLNRPSETPLAHISEELSGLAAPPGLVHVGGPVSPAAAVCLGRARLDASLRERGDEAPGVSLLFGRVVSVDLDQAVEALGEVVEELRLFAGYAGWAAGQLEGEVALGGWFIVDRSDDDVFSAAPKCLWRQVLRRQPKQSLALLASYPDDLSLN